MSTSLSRPLPSRDTTFTAAVMGGIAVALGLFTTATLTGQWSFVSTTVGNVLTQIGHWLGATSAVDSQVYWYMARSAGIVAYLLLWGSVAWGLMVSNKILDGIVKPPAVYELHKTLSILALVVGMFHGFILLGDTYMKFTIFDILIPFVSPYQPFWVGLGILGLYLTAILVVSFYIKKRIGHRAWRLLHYSSFLVWIMTSLHGLMSGTDSKLLLMQVMYTAAIASVSYLLFYRIAAAREKQAARVQVR
jgi:predicted ferric reductase